MGEKSLEKWDTKEEINFIKNVLGTVRPKGMQKLSKFDLLCAYRDGCLKREVWNGLDREKILQIALEEIGNLVFAMVPKTKRLRRK